MNFVTKAILNEGSDRLVILLTGRYQSAENFLSYYSGIDANLVAVQPVTQEWYPLPNGIDNQYDAMIGIKQNLPYLHKIVKKIISTLEIPKNKTSIVGFSAGGVMALELLSHNKLPFHSVVIHAGAILRLEKFPQAKNNTPVLLLHKKDDECFEWNERFVPMLNCLQNKGYNVSTVISDEGQHNISQEDIMIAINFMNNNGPFVNPF